MRIETQHHRQHRIDEHGNGAEHGDAGDGIGDVLVRSVRHRVRGDHRRGAADRGSGRDQFRQLSIDAHQASKTDDEHEGGKESRHDHGQAAAADGDHLRRGELEAQHDDRRSQHRPQGEAHARLRQGRRAGKVVKGDADDDGQDHRAQGGHAGQEAQREGDERDRRRQRQAGQRVAGGLARRCARDRLGRFEFRCDRKT